MRVRIETDGASRGNPGLAAGAAVLYDETGRPLVRVTEYLEHATNNVAEYTGLLIGLREAKAMGADKVDVFADSELMVRQLRGVYRVKNEGLKPLYVEVARLLSGFAAYRLEHVPRRLNKAADRAANDAVDRRASFREEFA